MLVVDATSPAVRASEGVRARRSPPPHPEDVISMRTRSRSRRTATAVVVSFALLLAACGGTDTELSIEPAADETDQVEQEPAPAPEGADEAPEVIDDEPADTEDAADEAPAEGVDAGAPAPDAAADCSAQGASITVRPIPGMPAEVAAARDFLLDAALRCDEQLLFTATEESDMFTFSFGDDTDPIGYWWQLEAAGEKPFLRLAQVLGTTPALSAGGDVYVWPRVTTGRPEDTTAEAWAELTWLPADHRVTGDGYLDWRAGISPDGQWRFFVSGD
jgi:hypothetical protein